MERNIALYLAYGYRETAAGPIRMRWVLVDMAKAM
jgi:hypothetical protein